MRSLEHVRDSSFRSVPWHTVHKAVIFFLFLSIEGTAKAYLLPYCSSYVVLTQTDSPLRLPQSLAAGARAPLAPGPPASGDWYDEH